MADVFQAGEKVRFSGVYKVVHAREHNQAHHVTAVHGEAFPGCLRCSDEVQFELILCAVRVTAHPLFDRKRASTKRRRLSQLVSMLRAFRRIRWRGPIK